MISFQQLGLACDPYINFVHFTNPLHLHCTATKARKLRKKLAGYLFFGQGQGIFVSLLWAKRNQE
jgi:hypothetical protein